MNTPSTYGLIRWLTSITRPVHPPLLVSSVLRCVNLGLELVLFGLAGLLVASFASGHPVGGLLLWIVMVALAKALAHYAEQFTGHYVAFKVLELLRGHAFASLWPKAPAVVLRNRSGDLLPTLTRDVDRIEVVYAHTFAPLVSAFVVPIAALATVGSLIGWDLVTIPAVCIALALLAVPFVGLRRSLHSTAEGLRLRGQLTAHATDSVYGIDEVLSYGHQRSRIEELDTLGSQVRDAAMPPLVFKGLRRGANLALTLISATSIVWTGISGHTDPLVVAALAAASLRLFEGPRGVQDAVGYLDHSLSAARRLWGLCHAPKTVSDGPQELHLEAPPSIEWRDVDYHYPGAMPGNLALSGISVTANAGRWTVFVGASGSGKSTAAQLLLRYDELAGGDILINGISVRDYTLDSLRRTIVLVPQRGQVLDATIAENLRLGAPDATDEDLWHALAVAELADEVRAMPQELATRTGRDGRELSGGQLQRLCLARALLVKPRVLVLDEFTANLNIDLEARIRANLEHALPGLTVIEITHRLEHLDSADRVFEFDRGKVTSRTVPR
ncbi:ABC transporter ATP-binding protein [Arachnia propionica]|uniref:amino acid ABC transporter ATP-binding/permease protein n=1 Tax=Arachnia propionica TaxID=1750 RepID=UPI0030CE4FC7